MNVFIRTSQNVELEYPLADFFVRLAAFILDVIFSVALYLIFLFMFSNWEVMQILLVILFFFLYHISFEIFLNGQSPGKKIVRIQVVSLDGNPATLEQLLMRWSFRLIDIGFTLGSLGAMAIISSPLKQKLGDSLAGTIVINKNYGAKNKLDTLTKLNELKKDHIQPGLKKYTDEEMLVIKNLLLRSKTYPTFENTELIRKMANTIKTNLGENDNDESAEKYLHRILNDYIIITR